MEHKETAEMIVVTSINALAGSINRWAVGRGFWPDLEVAGSDVGNAAIRMAQKSQKAMLVVTEVAELVEGLRKSEPGTIELNDGTTLTNEEEEVADAIIRLLDYAAQYKLRIGEAILAKMAKNEGRPYKHGKEF